jgi:RHS repeat-associated protein
MAMPGRDYQSTKYRYGFNGKENDKDISEGGQDYGMRIYDGRIGKFLSVDPLSREYPWNSSYAYAENDVIRSIDIDGMEKLIVILNKDKYGRSESIIIAGIRTSDNVKEAVDVNLKFANNKDVTTKDVLTITRQKGKVDQMSFSDLSKANVEMIKKANPKEPDYQDNNIPIPEGANSAIQQNSPYRSSVLTGVETYDASKYELFYSKQKFKLSPPVVQENKTGTYIYYNDGGAPAGDLDNRIIAAKNAAFDQQNPNAKSKMIEVTIKGTKKGIKYLNEVKSKILEQNKNLNIKVNIDTNSSFKPKDESNSVNKNNDYNISLKISGVN